jgi:hypothetical protein
MPAAFLLQTLTQPVIIYVIMADQPICDQDTPDPWVIQWPASTGPFYLVRQDSLFGVSFLFHDFVQAATTMTDSFSDFHLW